MSAPDETASRRDPDKSVLDRPRDPAHDGPVEQALPHGALPGDDMAANVASANPAAGGGGTAVVPPRAPDVSRVKRPLLAVGAIVAALVILVLVF